MRPASPSSRHWMALAALGSAAWMSATALAADAGSDLRRLQDETRDDLRTPPVQAPALPTGAPSRSAAAAAASTAATHITGFDVHGVSLLDEATVQSVLAPWSGRSLDTQGLHDAALALQAHYRKQGYFMAKVLIPPQTFSDVVRLDVYEGRFDQISVEVINKGKLTDTAAVQGVLEHYLRPGEVVTVPNVERSLLLTEDLPAVRISSVMYPGETVGTTRLRTVITDEPAFTGNVDVDNFGSRDTGEVRLGTTLYWNSPSRVGDQVVTRLVTSGKGSNYAYVQYLRPVTPDGWRAGASVDYLRYRSNFYAGVGEARGAASDWQLMASYPVIRGRFSNLNFRGSAGQTRIHDRNDLGLDAKRRLDTVTLALDGDHSHDLWPDGTTYYNADLTMGRLRIESDDAYKAYDASGPKADGGFARLGFGVQRLQRLSGPWSAHVKFSGQLASGNLDSSQQYHLGGATSIAGYPVGQASGDQGWELHAELRRDIPTPWAGRLHGFVFAQHGQVTQHHSTWAGWQGSRTDMANTQSLSTVGVGIVQSLESQWLIRAMLGRQVGTNHLADPATGADLDGRTRNWRAWIQVVRYF